MYGQIPEEYGGHMWGPSGGREYMWEPSGGYVCAPRRLRLIDFDFSHSNIVGRAVPDVVSRAVANINGANVKGICEKCCLTEDSLNEQKTVQYICVCGKGLCGDCDKKKNHVDRYVIHIGYKKSDSVFIKPFNGTTLSFEPTSFLIGINFLIQKKPKKMSS
jgi:hypothetical protein